MKDSVGYLALTVLFNRHGDYGDWTEVDYRRGRDKRCGYKGPQDNYSRNRYYQPVDRQYYNGQRSNGRQLSNGQRSNGRQRSYGLHSYGLRSNGQQRSYA
ncbi:Polygalacturonase QRT2 [Dissostichus eleginoides]|uniref:Polygalacturonase QRT2 n=1 Tax=Dissostichus eleginoides TaxID=100907 RepID=A0AAD9F5C3_DISEL|nr:Polygalacturonase QRT2 [Dissostichus eleginoides]